MTDTELCPCTSGRPFAECCGPILAGTAKAATAEALMRSRYAAFVKNDMAYLGASLVAAKRPGFSASTIAAWNADVVWKGLEILETAQGGPDDERGEVRFVASYEKDGQAGDIREHARFRKKGGRWYYLDGKLEAAEPQAAPKRAPAGRNDPCPCGSGVKYNKCCGK